MRADRLLSLLMLLQSRGRMTADHLAEELEVSVRTIYRDMDSLSAAGIPVYTERGPGGGCALMDHYRTNLTGMKEDEVRALFMLSIPTPLMQLGVSQELKAALNKLSAALPTSQQQHEMVVRQRIHLDSSWWYQSEELTPFLADLYRAVWQDHKILLTYQLRFGGEVQRMVKPYGLVAKAGIWYLLHKKDGRFRILRVSKILNAEISDDLFPRESNFNLQECWKICCEDYEKDRAFYPVLLRVSPAMIKMLPFIFNERMLNRIEHTSVPDREGWTVITIVFESLEAARDRILGFGGAVEVLEPEPLRRSIVDHAKQIVRLYQE